MLSRGNSFLFAFFSLLLVFASCVGARAGGGAVKFKTDNGPDGYYYNVNGADRARYCSFYEAGEFEGQSIICGIRLRDLDSSTRTPGVDDYVIGGDLRSEDPNHVGYADIGTSGLIALTDSGSRGTCSTNGSPRTYTFGGGAGVPDPQTPFFLTCPQPANNNRLDGTDFCGILLDTSSAFANSARTQAYSLSENPLFASIGFNHFVEAVVFEPKFVDLNLRMSGSSRFPGDHGIPVMFARRICAVSQNNCVEETGDGPVSTSDDFITARIALDNNTCVPVSTNFTLLADRAGINPKLGLKDVTHLFRPVGGGGPIANPLLLPAKSRTNLVLEIKTVIKRKFVGSFPVNLPFVATSEDADNPPLVLDREERALGLRRSAGYYDDDSHGAFLFSQTPVVTGDVMMVRYDVADLQNRDDTGLTFSLPGAQVVGGEFGGSNLPGIDAFSVRHEDVVFARTPDPSPQGLVRQVGVIGDPGNVDGIAFGPPATTVNIDFTDVRLNPGNGVLRNLYGCAVLNPGDTGARVTAIGATRVGEVLVGNSSVSLAGVLRGTPLVDRDLEIRLDHGGASGGELGNPSNLIRKRTKPVKAPLFRPGSYIAIDENGLIE